MINFENEQELVKTACEMEGIYPNDYIYPVGLGRYYCIREGKDGPTFAYACVEPEDASTTVYIMLLKPVKYTGRIFIKDPERFRMKYPLDEEYLEIYFSSLQDYLKDHIAAQKFC